MEEIHNKHFLTNTQVWKHKRSLSEGLFPCPSSSRPLAIPSPHPTLWLLWLCYLFLFRLGCSSPSLPIRILSIAYRLSQRPFFIGSFFFIWMECFPPEPWPLQILSFLYDFECFLRLCLVWESSMLISVPAQECLRPKSREHGLFFSMPSTRLSIKEDRHKWDELNYLYEQLMPITFICLSCRILSSLRWPGGNYWAEGQWQTWAGEPLVTGDGSKRVVERRGTEVHSLFEVQQVLE